MENNIKISKTLLILKAGVILANIVGAVVALLGILVILIGVYHTTIFLIVKTLPSTTVFVIPTVTLALAAGVVFFKQPVHNLLCLITVFFITVFLFLRVGAEFLAFLFLIVYVGAIAILFLFVIMLLRLKELQPMEAANRSVTNGTVPVVVPSAIVAAVGLDDLLSHSLTEFLNTMNTVAFKTENTSINAVAWYVNNRFSDILAFSDLLYTYHSFLFFLAGLLLLTAMLGAIILATSVTDSEHTKSKPTEHN